MVTRRIETAIQRFAAKRNMDSTKKNLFDKYLVHGGIEAGPKMFSGGKLFHVQTSDYTKHWKSPLISGTCQASTPRHLLLGISKTLHY